MPPTFDLQKNVAGADVMLSFAAPDAISDGITAPYLGFAARNVEDDTDAILTDDVTITINSTTFQINVLIPSSITAGRDNRTYNCQCWRLDSPTRLVLIEGQMLLERSLLTGATPVDLGQFVTITYSATPTLNALDGDRFVLTLTGNAALTITNVKTGNLRELLIIQDGTGGRTLTIASPTVTWMTSDGNPPTIRSAAGAYSALFFQRYTATKLLGFTKV